MAPNLDCESSVDGTSVITEVEEQVILGVFVFILFVIDSVGAINVEAAAVLGVVVVVVAVVVVWIAVDVGVCVKNSITSSIS
jgi:hypothetical protein